MVNKQTELGPKASKTLKTILEGTKLTIKMSGYNKAGGNYKFLSQQDLVALDDFITEQGCVLLVSEIESSMGSDVFTVFNKSAGNNIPRMMTQSHSVIQARLQSVDDPEDFVIITCSGYKLDYNDKANGAQTIARRYAKMHLFNIPTDGKDEPDQQASVNDGGDLLAPKPQAPSDNLFASKKSPNPLFVN